jgi:hypothetical protein
VSEPDLGAFQAELLEALHAGGDPQAIVDRLLATTADPELAAWVRSWEPPFVEVAAAVTQRWAVVERAVSDSGR